jgi:hypothetical protein
MVNGRGGATLESVDEDGHLTVALDALEAGLSGAEAEGGPPLADGAVPPALYIAAERGGRCLITLPICAKGRSPRHRDLREASH